MAETFGNEVSPDHNREFTRWFDEAHEPWNPVAAAERQLDALAEDAETPRVLAAYDHLYEMAGQAMRWLEGNPCPDREIERRLKAQMMAYRIVAATVRFTFVAGCDATAAPLVDLRQLVDQHADTMTL